MKPKDKVLTYAQAKELRWFAKNCTGLHVDFYKWYDDFKGFKNKLDRLCKLAKAIESYFEVEFAELDKREAEMQAEFVRTQLPEEHLSSMTEPKK